MDRNPPASQQIDPVHAAAPWAAVRLIMQTAVSDFETFGVVLSSIERITNHISMCAIFELQYLQPEHANFAVHTDLSKAVTSLYKSILTFLCTTMRYYKLGTVRRHLKSLATSKADAEAKYRPIDTAQSAINDLAKLAEAQKTNMILEKMTKSPTEEPADPSAKVNQNRPDLVVLVQELQEPIARAASHLVHIKDSLDRETRIRILKAISTIPHLHHHKAARRGRLEGSGKWLLRKASFELWRSESSSSVLWLHGIPGSGKTKLTSVVVDELLGSNKIAFFYCARTPAEPFRGERDKILASLVRQLASVRPETPILAPVVEQFREAIDGLAEFGDQVWSAEESESVLKALLAEYPAVTIIIDGLDEVKYEDRQELLDVLGRLMKYSPNLLKVFISSRDNYDIVLQLEDSPNIYIEADDNQEDIVSFVHKRLDSARLLHGTLQDSLRSQIIQVLTDNARSMFLWVELQIQLLISLKVSADILDRLGKLPPTLEASYWELYQMILKSGKHASQFAIFIFQWLLYAEGIVTADGVAAIASVACSHLQEIGHHPEMDVSVQVSSGQIMDMCANLVVVRDSLFEFAHLSVREFLEALPQRQVETMKAESCHAAIGAACLRYFMKETYNKLSCINGAFEFPDGDVFGLSDGEEGEVAEPSSQQSKDTSGATGRWNLIRTDDTGSPQCTVELVKNTRMYKQKSIYEQVAEKLDDRNGSRANHYAVNLWHHHVARSGSLGEIMPLSALVSDLFGGKGVAVWCCCASKMRTQALPLVNEEKPAIPIWMTLILGSRGSGPALYNGVALDMRMHLYRQLSRSSTKVQRDIDNSKRPWPRVLQRIVSMIEIAHWMELADWRCHMGGLVACLQAATGRLGLIELDVGLLSAIGRGILLVEIYNTMAPPRSMLPVTSELIDQQMTYIYRFASIPGFPCPPTLFGQVREITKLRGKTASGVDVMQDAAFILEFIDFISPTENDRARFKNASDAVLVWDIFKLSVKLYCILALAMVKAGVQCGDGRPQKLMELLVHVWKIERFRTHLAWPLAVAGFALSCGGSSTDQGKVTEYLATLAGEYHLRGAAVAKEKLERFWASGKVGWDECWDETFIVTI